MGRFEYDITAVRVKVRSWVYGPEAFATDTIRLAEFDKGLQPNQWRFIGHANQVLEGLALRWKLATAGQVKAEASARCRCSRCGKSAAARSVDGLFPSARCDRCVIAEAVRLERWSERARERRSNRVPSHGWVPDGNGCVDRLAPAEIGWLNGSLA